ncbi:MAG: rhomboid family intramembrane serine protease [Lentimicrobiaceae bacterium]|nr:rhomboid family intramembrane serine protease [Lentimicrobiaceae bacterium]
MITYIIIALTAIISILAFNNAHLFHALVFNPYMIDSRKQGYRFLSYALLHADWMHLLVNMFVLLSFGKSVEGSYLALFGIKGIYLYALLYIGGVLLSTTPAYAKHRNNPAYSAVGASGAVSAVLFASIIIHPLASIRFLFIPFNIPAFVFGILYLIYSAYMAKRGRDNIGHDAHFWGAVFGLVFTLLLKPSLAIGFLNQLSGTSF